MIFVDESNFVAENAVQGAMSYVKKNNLGYDTDFNIINVGDEEAFQTVEKGFFLNTHLSMLQSLLIFSFFCNNYKIPGP